MSRLVSCFALVLILLAASCAHALDGVKRNCVGEKGCGIVSRHHGLLHRSRVLHPQAQPQKSVSVSPSDELPKHRPATQKKSKPADNKAKKPTKETNVASKVILPKAGDKGTSAL